MKRAWLLGVALIAVQQVSLAALFGEDVDNKARQEITDTKSEMQQQFKSLDKRMNSLEVGIKNLGLVEMVSQIEQLKEEMGKLRGQIELQNNQIETTQKRQRELYLDLDSRLRALEKPGSTSSSGDNAAPSSPSAPTNEAKTEAPAADASQPVVKEETKPAVTMAPPTAPISPPPTASVTPKPAPKPPVVTATPKSAAPAAEGGGDIKSYEEAHKIFRSGNYQGAVNAFRGFIEQYPSSILSSNAQYWIGISFYNLKDLKSALGAHQQLLKRYPDSPKVPDSMLNIATIQSDLNDQAAAKTTLEDIVSKYPNSEAATKAKSRLAKRP
jgi:tol-pal system protein YbgF